MTIEIPPMGPCIHISYKNNTSENARNLLDFAITRLEIFENNDNQISILEYIELHEYVNNCTGNFIFEKDTTECYYYNYLTRQLNDRFEKLLDTKQFYNDIPDKEIEIKIYNLTLYINSQRIYVRYSINKLYNYLENIDIIDQDSLIKIKHYLDLVYEYKIFRKEDIKSCFTKKWQNILFD
jgi:hypothetical protein